MVLISIPHGGRFAVLLALVALAARCSDAARPPLEPVEPVEVGPLPDIRLTREFGGSPLEGEIFLTPDPADVGGWSYAIDLDEDGAPDHSGLLESPIGFPYRFDDPGPHTVVTTLTSPDTMFMVERVVVVNTPGAVRILSSGRIEPMDRTFSIFEGIAIDPDGQTLYVGDFLSGAIAEVDAATLTLRRWLDLWRGGVEGLAVSPSGDFLFAAFKRGTPIRIALDTFEVDAGQNTGSSENFFVAALDDRRIIVEGHALRVVDVVVGDTLATFDGVGEGFFNPRHFNVDPARNRVVVAGGSALYLLDLPSLAVLATLPPDSTLVFEAVAFDASGETIYATAWPPPVAEPFGDPGDPWQIVVIDAGTMRIVRRIRLEEGGCNLCVANPVALSREGRWLVFERHRTLFVDTRTGLATYRLDPAESGSVVADPTMDGAFYLLRSDGLIHRVVVDP